MPDDVDDAEDNAAPPEARRGDAPPTSADDYEMSSLERTTSEPEQAARAAQHVDRLAHQNRPTADGPGIRTTEATAPEPDAPPNGP